MDANIFDEVLDDAVTRSTSVLSAKAGEYAGPTDRLHNFKQAAHLQRITQAEALGGMMAKHTVSIYDMIDRGDVNAFPIEVWHEKITDHINYLLLLNAIVAEEQGEQMVGQTFDEAQPQQDPETQVTGTYVVEHESADEAGLRMVSRSA